jgi:hypothetical protein
LKIFFMIFFNLNIYSFDQDLQALTFGFQSLNSILGFDYFSSTTCQPKYYSLSILAQKFQILVRIAQ